MLEELESAEVAESALKGCFYMLTWCFKVKVFKGRQTCLHGVENNARVIKGCWKGMQSVLEGC